MVNGNFGGQRLALTVDRLPFTDYCSPSAPRRGGCRRRLCRRAGLIVVETAVPPQANERGQADGHGQRMDRGDRHFGHDRGGFGWGFFPLAFLIGGFFKFALFALIIGGLFKFFGWGGPWRHHHKGHRPPWAKRHKRDEASSEEAPGAEKAPEDVEPDIKIG